MNTHRLLRTPMSWRERLIAWCVSNFTIGNVIATTLFVATIIWGIKRG